MQLDAETSDQVDLLRWWHQYQIQMLNYEADLIRNGLLQDIVAMRQQLEVCCHSQVNSHLDSLKKLHRLVETLSDHLDPPYLHDSLPLALQHAAQPWQDTIHLGIVLPTTWEAEPLEHNRLLIKFVENLLQQIATAEPLPDNCHLTLQDQAGVKKLTFQAQYSAALPSSLSLQVLSAVNPFLKTFQLFTKGDYNQDIQSQSLTCLLHWKPQARMMNAPAPV